MITIQPAAAAELQKLAGVIRLQVRTSGCCEPLLAAFRDEQRPGDVVADLGGLCMVIDPQSLEITGEVTVDLDHPGDPPSLKLTTARALSEWSGLLCTVIEPGPPQ